MNILDLNRSDFNAAVAELAAQGVDVSGIRQQYREQSSPFSGLFDYANRQQDRIASAGRTPIAGGLLSKPEGSTGMDAVRGVEVEPMAFLSGLLSGGAQAIDAPAAAMRGDLTRDEMAAEALGTAGVAMGGGLSLSGRGALDYDPTVVSANPSLRGVNKELLDPLGYQKTKMRGYLADTDVQLSDLGENLERQPMSWEDLEGKVVLPFYGDRTSRGLMVEGVNDLKFDEPVYTEGGVDFMRGPAAQADRAIWASNQNIVKRIESEAGKAAREFEGRDVVGITGSMAPDANDFATMTGAAMAELVKGSKITKKAAKEFDAVMKAVDPDFVGVLSPNLRDWATSTSSPKRKSFIRLMDSAPMQQKGFPSPAEARYSVTDPTQRDMGAGMFGLGASKIDTAAPLMYNQPKGNLPRTSVPHSTYNTQIAGDYLGSLPPVPQGLLFRDVYNAMEGKTTKTGQPLNEAHRTHAIKTKMPAQVMTPQVIEGILDYISRTGR